MEPRGLLALRGWGCCRKGPEDEGPAALNTRRLRQKMTKVYLRRLACRRWWTVAEILMDEGKRAAYEVEMAAQEASRLEAAKEAERQREEEVAERVRLAAEEAAEEVRREQQEAAEEEKRKAEEAGRAAQAEREQLLAAHQLELATQARSTLRDAAGA